MSIQEIKYSFDINPITLPYKQVNMKLDRLVITRFMSDIALYNYLKNIQINIILGDCQIATYYFELLLNLPDTIISNGDVLQIHVPANYTPSINRQMSNMQALDIELYNINLQQRLTNTEHISVIMQESPLTDTIYSSYYYMTKYHIREIPSGGYRIADNIYVIDHDYLIYHDNVAERLSFIDINMLERKLYSYIKTLHRSGTPLILLHNIKNTITVILCLNQVFSEPSIKESSNSHSDLSIKESSNSHSDLSIKESSNSHSDLSIKESSNSHSDLSIKEFSKSHSNLSINELKSSIIEACKQSREINDNWLSSGAAKMLCDILKILKN